jgi:hypothetical protein
MRLHFRATERSELNSVADFLRSVLHPEADYPTVQTKHMAWKYYEPREDWAGSRSFVLEEGDRIVAHLAVMPGCLRTSTGTVRAMHFIDWAAEPGSFIAGSSLLRKVMRQFDLTFCIGGSPDNRRALPMLGFRPAQKTELYARPLRPWLQTRTHQYRNWKLPLRFGRNLFHAVSPARNPGAWRAVEVLPKEVPERLWLPASNGATTRVRQASTYEYFIRSSCPVFRFYMLLEAENPRGCLCLAFPPGQARMADIWLAEPSVEAFTGALAVAQQAACEVPGAAEALLRVSTPMLREAAVRSGFRLIEQTDLMAWSATALPAIPIEAPLIADDACFLHSGAPQYLT